MYKLSAHSVIYNLMSVHTREVGGFDDNDRVVSYLTHAQVGQSELCDLGYSILAYWGALLPSSSRALTYRYIYIDKFSSGIKSMGKI